MAIALVTSKSQQSPDGNGFTTSGFDSSGANFLVIAITYLDSSSVHPFITTDFSDSKSNTWTALTNQISQGLPDAFIAIRFFYCKNPTVGSGHTFTLTYASGSSPFYPTISILAYSGVDTTSPFDQENGIFVFNNAATSIQPGSITPSSNNYLVVSAVSLKESSADYSINSGLTIREANPLSSGKAFGQAIADLVQGTAAAINPTWTASGGNFYNCVIASFKVAAGGGGTAIKTWNGLADASVKTFNGLARASVKTRDGLA